MAFPKLLRDIREVRDESITATSAILESGSVILELPTEVTTGSVVKFTSPCGCNRITTGITIDGMTYVLVDALNNPLTEKEGYWDANAQISVVIDAVNQKAYVQNSAEAEYLLNAHDSNNTAHPEMAASISDLELRVAKLDTFLMSDVTTNPHMMTLDSLDGLVVTGVWNEAQSRLEC